MSEYKCTVCGGSVSKHVSPDSNFYVCSECVQHRPESLGAVVAGLNIPRLSFEHFKGAMEACGYVLKVERPGRGLRLRVCTINREVLRLNSDELTALGWDLGWLDGKEPSHE